MVVRVICPWFYLILVSFLFISFNSQMVVWVIWQWSDLICFFYFYCWFTDGCVSHLSVIIFDIGFFLSISFNSQMVVWVIWQWLNKILVSFYGYFIFTTLGNYLALGLYLAGKCRHPGHSFHLWHHDVLNATTPTLYQWHAVATSGNLTACSTFDEVTKYSCLPMVPPGLLLLGLVMELLPLYFHPALGALLY